MGIESVSSRLRGGGVGDFTGDVGFRDLTDDDSDWSFCLENIDCIGACINSLLLTNGWELFMGIIISLGNMLAMEGLGEEEAGSGELTLTEFVSIGLRSGDEASLKLSEGVGDGDLTGSEPVELGAGEPKRRMIVEEIVLRAACLARSVLTKLVTSSSRLPLRLGEASSSSGPTSVAGGDEI